MMFFLSIVQGLYLEQSLCMDESKNGRLFHLVGIFLTVGPELQKGVHLSNATGAVDVMCPPAATPVARSETPLFRLP